MSSKPATSGAFTANKHEIPKIAPKNFQWDAQGFHTRLAFVRLPEQIATSQALLDEPKVWRKIQNDRGRALRRFDRITAIAHDESWLLDAVVAHADPYGVTLMPTKVLAMPARQDEHLSPDKQYKCCWSHEGGYTCVRISDGAQMFPARFQNLAGAIAEMNRTLYKAT